MTILSGPPGAGKTTLLAEWIAAQPGAPLAWLSVDELDNDQAHFWTYLIASLQRLEPTIGVEALDLLSDDAERKELRFVESLVMDLSGVEPSITLVIDDLHLIEARPVLRALAYLVDHLPGSLRLVLSSRVDPPLSLHRLRANRELLEIRQSDLRFAEEETAILLRRVGGVRLSPSEVQVLTDRTEGWIAGLQLAGLALRGEEDPKEFIERVAVLHPTIADYLLGEVIERQPKHVQDFLLKTSVLKELTASSCDAITDRTDSHKLLRLLEAQNLFVLPIEATQHSYRYHRLFAELLQSELRATDPDAWRAAHLRAADWHVAQESPAEAINHLFAGRFWDEALDLLIQNVPLFYDSGQATRMLRWLEQFPEGFFDTRPKRILDLALVLSVGGNYAEAGRCLDLAERILGTDRQQNVVQQVRLKGLRALWFHLVGHAAAAIEWAEKAIDSYRPEADDGIFDRFPDGLVRSWGWLDDARSAWEAQRRSYPFPQPLESISRFLAPATTSQICLIEGRLSDAERLADEALAYANPRGPEHPVLIEARLTRAGVYWERNRLDWSEREFESSQREAERNRRIAFQVIASLGLARVWAASGRRDQAFDILSSCRRANHPLAVPEPFASRLDAFEARLLLADGAVSEARRRIDRLPASVGAEFLRIRLALAADDHATARRELAHLETRVTTLRQRLEWELLDARSGSKSAGGSLAAAVDFARREQFIRPFVDEGVEMPALLHQHSFVDSASFVQELIAACDASTPSASPADSSLVDPLSEREQVVLSYLPSWVSNEEIASELYISLNTLKTHLRSIYRKLGANSRREAVNLARQHALL